MEIQLIRNACLKIKYNNRIILVDPMLGPKHSLPSFGGLEQNPTVDLPIPIEEIIKQVDFILLTHMHMDHWDETAQERIPKDLPIFCQPVDVEKLENQGFSRVSGIEAHSSFEGIDITRFKGQHGSGDVLGLMGESSGFLIDSKSEPSIFIAGDTILTESLIEFISSKRPEITITNSGGAYMQDFPKDKILMDVEETIKVAELCFPYLLIAVHLESLDHCTVSRDELKLISDLNEEFNLFVPEDGDIITFEE